jgi:diguanylate cyclase
MEYQQDIDHAQEIARLVFPLMARLKIPINPVNYALWYEYFLGRSRELVEHLDRIESGREAYESERARELFLRYVATPGVETLEKIETEVCRLLADIVQIIIDAGLDLTKYSAVLKSCTSRLKNADDIRDIRKLVRTLLSDTQNMSESNRKVATSLKERSAEIDTLRGELDRVRREAVRDPLTGLANRRAFDAALAEALDATLQQMKSICLMIIDIDDFKSINDRHGQQIGDRILRYLAEALTGNIKGRDLVARYGGDEFAVMLESAPRSGVESLAESIRQQIENAALKRTDTGEPLGKVTVSIGYDCGRPGDSPTRLLDRADRALYQAKSRGRNRAIGYED